MVSTQMGSRAGPAKPLGRIHQPRTKNSAKPNPTAKIFGRNEAIENVRLLRLEDSEIARNATPVKAPLTARRPRAAWPAAASRAEELIWRRRRRKSRPEGTLSVDRGSRLMEELSHRHPRISANLLEGLSPIRASAAHCPSRSNSAPCH